MKKTLWGLIIILICAGLALLVIKPNKYDFKALSQNGEVIKLDNIGVTKNFK